MPSSRKVINTHFKAWLWGRIEDLEEGTYLDDSEIENNMHEAFIAGYEMGQAVGEAQAQTYPTLNQSCDRSTDEVTEAVIRDPDTGKERVVYIPKLSHLECG